MKHLKIITSVAAAAAMVAGCTPGGSGFTFGEFASGIDVGAYLTGSGSEQFTETEYRRVGDADATEEGPWQQLYIDRRTTSGSASFNRMETIIGRGIANDFNNAVVDSSGKTFYTEVDVTNIQGTETELTETEDKNDSSLNTETEYTSTDMVPDQRALNALRGLSSTGLIWHDVLQGNDTLAGWWNLPIITAETAEQGDAWDDGGLSDSTVFVVENVNEEGSVTIDGEATDAELLEVAVKRLDNDSIQDSIDNCIDKTNFEDVTKSGSTSFTTEGEVINDFMCPPQLLDLMMTTYNGLVVALQGTFITFALNPWSYSVDTDPGYGYEIIVENCDDDDDPATAGVEARFITTDSSDILNQDVNGTECADTANSNGDGVLAFGERLDFDFFQHPDVQRYVHYTLTERTLEYNVDSITNPEEE